MNQDLLMTVVVPTYGRPDLFEETLASLQSQTIDEFEVIVSDNSVNPEDRDKIQALLKRYQQNTNRPGRYLFTRPNLGLAANSNQGLAAVRTKYARVLHSDDLLSADCLKLEIGILSDPNVDVDFLFHDAVGFPDAPYWRHHAAAVSLVSPRWYYLRFLHTQTPIPSAMVFSTDALKKVGMYSEDMRFIVDWDLTHRLLYSAEEQQKMVAHVSYGHIAYRLHSNTITGSQWKDHFREIEGYIDSTCNDPNYPFRFSLTNEERMQFIQKALKYRYKRLTNDFYASDPCQVIKELPNFLSLYNSSTSIRQAQMCGLDDFFDQLPQKQQSSEIVKWVNGLKESDANSSKCKNSNTIIGKLDDYEPGIVKSATGISNVIEITSKKDFAKPLLDRTTVVLDYNEPGILKECGRLLSQCNDLVVKGVQYDDHYETVLLESIKHLCKGASVAIQIQNHQEDLESKIKNLFATSKMNITNLDVSEAYLSPQVIKFNYESIEQDTFDRSNRLKSKHGNKELQRKNKLDQTEGRESGVMWKWKQICRWMRVTSRTHQSYQDKLKKLQICLSEELAILHNLPGEEFDKKLRSPRSLRIMALFTTIKLFSLGKRASISRLHKLRICVSEELARVTDLIKTQPPAEILTFPVSGSETAIVMQGLIQYDNDFTYSTLKHYRHLFPGAILILSTWGDSDAATIDRIRGLGVDVILNQYPPKQGQTNLIYQVHTTYQGMLRAQELGAKYVMKTRTDTRIDYQHSIAYLESLLKSFPVTNSNKPHGRFVILDYATRLYIPNHPSDILMFGYLQDMLLYWSIPLAQVDLNFGNVGRFIDIAVSKLPENVLCEHYLRQINYCDDETIIEKSISTWWKVLRDLFVVVDRSALNFYWVKNHDVCEEIKFDMVRKTNNVGSIGATRNLDLCTFRDWLSIYKLDRQCQITLDEIANDGWDAMIHFNRKASA